MQMASPVKRGERRGWFSSAAFSNPNRDTQVRHSSLTWVFLLDGAPV
jgi:hypothetical protein